MEIRKQLCEAILNNNQFLINLILKNPLLKKCCKNCFPYSPLYLSILTGNKELSKKIIKQSSDEDLNEVTYYSPFQLCLKVYDLDTALLLISRKVKPKSLIIKERSRLKNFIIYQYIFNDLFNEMVNILHLPIEIIYKIIKYL